MRGDGRKILGPGYGQQNVARDEDPKDSHHATTIGQAFNGAPFGPARKDAYNAGTHYLLPFEIVSVHLLVVLIGAAYLARAKRRKEEKT